MIPIVIMKCMFGFQLRDCKILKRTFETENQKTKHAHFIDSNLTATVVGRKKIPIETHSTELSDPLH